MTPESEHRIEAMADTLSSLTEKQLSEIRDKILRGYINEASDLEKTVMEMVFTDGHSR